MLYAAPLPAHTLQGMVQFCYNALCDDGDTFYSQRVFDLFPRMATANSGFATHTAQATWVFGSGIGSTVNDDALYLEWNVYVPAGTYLLKVLRPTNSNYGILSLKVDGSAVDSLDQYTAGPTVNGIWTSTTFVLTEGLHTIRLQKNSKHASASAYYCWLQHVQLIKQDAGSSLADPNYAPKIIDVPIVFADSHTNWNTLSMSTSMAFGTRRVSSGAQNDAVTFSFWAPQGNATLAMLISGGGTSGIMTVAVDGSTWGTIDTLNIGNNITNTSLTGSIASTGMHTITVTMATSSAANYYGELHHIQIRMTSISAAITQDTAPEIALFWPYLHGVVSSGWTLQVSSGYAYYHRRYSSNANTSYIEWNNIVLRPGTYRLDILTATHALYAKGSIYIDDVDTGLEYDGYGSAVDNVIKSVSGITISDTAPKTLKIKNEDRHASATGWYIVFMGAPLRFVRTGD